MTTDTAGAALTLVLPPTRSPVPPAARNRSTSRQEQLHPKGVGVVLEAEHSCMSLRGVQKTGSKTVTSALHGLVREDQRTRQELLELAR